MADLSGHLAHSTGPSTEEVPHEQMDVPGLDAAAG